MKASPAASETPVPVSERDRLGSIALDQWRGWMRDERGLTEKTIGARCRYAAGLLDVVTPADGPVGWDRVDVSVVNAYSPSVGGLTGSPLAPTSWTRSAACCDGR